MEIKYENKSLISRRLHHDRKQFMYNYFSIGVDALVTLNFHKARESAFYIVKSKIINKFMYFIYGTQQVLSQDCSNLEQKIEVYLDNVKLDLPELQSIVLLNIDSWGAGVKLVEMFRDNDENFVKSHSISDGILEVFGIVSSFHIAQLQIGLSTPLRLGQAKEVKVSILFVRIFKIL
jgi:diacylglycerol kinase (ATP)